MSSPKPTRSDDYQPSTIADGAPKFPGNLFNTKALVQDNGLGIGDGKNDPAERHSEGVDRVMSNAGKGLRRSNPDLEEDLKLGFSETNTLDEDDESLSSNESEELQLKDGIVEITDPLGLLEKHHVREADFSGDPNAKFQEKEPIGVAVEIGSPPPKPKRQSSGGEKNSYIPPDLKRFSSHDLTEKTAASTEFAEGSQNSMGLSGLASPQISTYKISAGKEYSYDDFSESLNGTDDLNGEEKHQVRCPKR